MSVPRPWPPERQELCPNRLPRFACGFQPTCYHFEVLNPENYVHAVESVQYRLFKGEQAYGWKIAGNNNSSLYHFPHKLELIRCPDQNYYFLLQPNIRYFFFETEPGCICAPPQRQD